METYYDENTESVIGYLKAEGKDGYTSAGTWVNYLNKQAVVA